MYIYFLPVVCKKSLEYCDFCPICCTDMASGKFFKNLHNELLKTNHVQKLFSALIIAVFPSFHINCGLKTFYIIVNNILIIVRST